MAENALKAVRNSINRMWIIKQKMECGEDADKVYYYQLKSEVKK